VVVFYHCQYTDSLKVHTEDYIISGRALFMIKFHKMLEWYPSNIAAGNPMLKVQVRSPFEWEVIVVATLL